MATTIRFDDGQEVILSEETTRRLRKELLGPKHPIATVCYWQGEKRLVLNLPEACLAEHCKGRIIILNKDGCVNRYLKTEELPNIYRNPIRVI